MEIKDLYAQKGEILTKIEILQSQLQQVNKGIIEAINASKASQKPEEVKEN